MSARVFLAGLFHETNTFLDRPTRREAFRILRGEEIFRARGDASPMDGFLSSAAEYGWTVLPGVDCRAQPSGMPEDEIFETYWEELQLRLDAALQGGLDAIFLILHGAMATPSYPDVEGEFLERIRTRPGTGDLPVFAVLDLHANVSERMARHATALVPYRENPHVDARATAVRAARLLWRALTSRTKPRTHFAAARILLAPPSTATAATPMRDLEAAARALEASAGHWEVGVAAGFAHADTPDTGVSFWVVSDRPEIVCHRSLESLVVLARSLAREVRPDAWELSEALDAIARERRFPALLVEPADNIGGGAPGDATVILEALLKRPLGRCGVVLCAPDAVAALARLPLGQPVSLALGGAHPGENGRLQIEGFVLRRTDGSFDLEDRKSHLASMAGSRIEMGPCAVVIQDHVTILLTSRPTPPFDLGQWRSQGIDPASLDIITVKAAVGHRRAYDAITASSYTVSTPGPCSSDLHRLPYRKIRRPILPLDP